MSGDSSVIRLFMHAINDHIESSLRNVYSSIYNLSRFIKLDSLMNISACVMSYLMNHQMETKRIMSSSSPGSQIGISIYVAASQEKGNEIMLLMLGIHPNQATVNDIYLASYRQCFAVSYTLLMLREHCRQYPGYDSLYGQIEELLSQCLDINCRILSGEACTPIAHNGIQSSIIEMISHSEIFNWIHESYQYIMDVIGANIGNACLYLIFGEFVTHIESITYQRSSDPKYNRVTVGFKDFKNASLWNMQQFSSPHFSLFRYAPMFHFLVYIDDFVESMIGTFWNVIKDSAYHYTLELRSHLTPLLRKFFIQGAKWKSSGNSQIDLSASFLSSYRMSSYWHGMRGSG